MATSINVGQTLPMTIEFLDSNGAVIPPANLPALDAAPVWANSNVADAVLTVAAGSMTAELLGTVEGTATVTLTLSVGGVMFTATLDVTVSATGVVTVAAIRIVPGTPTP